MINVNKTNVIHKHFKFFRLFYFLFDYEVES